MSKTLKEKFSPQNPLLENYKTPPFEHIREEHFAPAFEDAFSDLRAAYETLRDQDDTPSFENTVKPFDTLFAKADRLFTVLNNLVLNARTDELKNIAQKAETEYDGIRKEIFQDRVLGARFKAVYDSIDKKGAASGLDREDQWFLHTIYKSFEDNGAFLNEKGQKRLKEIDAKLIAVSKQFNDNHDDGQTQQSFLITDKTMLAGVPAETVASFAQNAKDAGHKDGALLFVPERLMVDDLLEVAQNRDFRKKIFDALNKIGTQAPYDNEPVLKEFNSLRNERAGLLGYQSYADYHLSRTMAGSVARVTDLLEKSAKHLVPAFEKDMQTLTDWAQQKGGPKTLEPWDVPFYTRGYKQETFGFDSSELAEYLELDNVLKGWLGHTEKAFNVSFKENASYQTWHEDVLAYDVTDHDTGEESILLIDLYARPGRKYGGAWMNEVQSADKAAGRKNITVFNMNLDKGDGTTPVLVSRSQVETFYHEGGHALNGLKGDAAKYATRRGTGNGSDYVEIHSMLQENWAFEPENLDHYARHHKTGKKVPPSLLDSMEKSANFMGMRDALKVIQNSLRDLKFHSTPAKDYKGAAATEKAADFNSPVSDHIRSYPLTRFGHLFADAASQYASGYYGYFWSDVAQSQAYDLFQDKGPYDQKLLEDMRAFYAAGAGLEPNEAYKNFAGKDAGDPAALLRRLGIDVSKNGDGPKNKPTAPAGP